MTVDIERLARETREALVYSLGITLNCEALFDYVGEMDFKNDFVFVVEDNEQSLSAITDSAIKPALEIIKSQSAEIERLRELVQEMADHSTYETEYAGRAYIICHGCGAQDGEDHRISDCVYLRAKDELSGEQK